MLAFIRAILRFIGFVFLCSFYVLQAFVRALRFPQRLDSFYHSLKQWSIVVKKMLGIEVKVVGEIPNECVLLVPNHRSYIDISLLPPFFKTVFVAKKEVQSWPIIGQGGNLAQTVWVKRESAESRRETRDAILERLSQGFNVVVYPEGTTCKAPELKEFRPGMFYRAAEGNIPVVPVAIEYGEVDDAWVGSDTFVPHFLQCFRKRKTMVHMHIGPIMRDTDGERLRLSAQNWIREQLTLMAQDMQLPIPSDG
ncbi:MAG: lysophospholipid acyltransferase family protein [Bacteroidota bacterium]